MSQEDTNAGESAQKPSKLPLILGLVLALVGGGGGFYAVYSGMVLGTATAEADVAESTPELEMPDVAFVEVAPLTVSLIEGARERHLRFRAQLETPGRYKSDVEKLLPRIIDVLNSYLRAVELDDLKNASALVRLRAQMLRRVQVVVGEGRVNDLLIMEFVLN